MNLPYVSYYDNLVELYVSPTNCEKTLKKEFTIAVDVVSKLSAHLFVNPIL